MVSMRSAEPEIKECHYCGAQFGTHYGATFCSSACGAKYGHSKNGSMPPEERAEPAPRTEPYDATCLMCTRVQRRYWLSSEHARLRAIVGFPRCAVPHCGGLVVLEPVLSGWPGTFDPTIPMRVKTRQTMVVPTGRKP